MQFQATLAPFDRLPVKHSLTIAYALSFVVALVTAAASIAGLLWQTTIYPTEALRQSYVTNDAVNLVVGLPILLGCIWLARNGRLVGLLCWPGTLLYVFYNATAYVFGRPFDWLTWVNLAIALLSATAIVELVRNVNQKTVQAQLSDVVPYKTAGWVLAVFGILFFFRAVGVMAQASMSQATLPIAEVGVLVADVVVSLLWTAGGVLLLRRMPLGYVSGLGLLFAASLLFAGLILFFLLQPVLTDVPFALTDLMVIALMSLICFVPTWLFARGVLVKGG